MKEKPFYGPFLPNIQLCRGIAVTCLLFLLAVDPLSAGEPDAHRLRLAREYTVQGDLEKALREYRNLLVENPDNAEIYREMGEVNLLQKRPDLAIEAFKMQARYASDSLSKKRIETKIAGLQPQGDGVSQSDPTDDGAAGDSEVGGKSTAKGIYADADFLKAIELYKAKNTEGALEAIHKTLAKHKGHPGAYYLAGVIRYNKKEYAKALYNFQRSYAYPDRGNNAHYYVGRIHEIANRPEAAVRSFKTYLQGDASPEGKRQAQARVDKLEASLAAKKPIPTAPPVAAKSGSDRPLDPKPPTVATPPDPPESTSQDASKPRFSLLKVIEVSGFPEEEGHRFFLPDPGGVGGSETRGAFLEYHEGRLESSIRKFRELILKYAGSPNAEAAALNLATVYLRLGLTQNAEVQVNDYLRASPATGGIFTNHAQYLSALIALGGKEWVPAEQILADMRPGENFGPSQEALGAALERVGALSRDTTKWTAYLQKAESNSRLVGKKMYYRQQLGLLHQHQGRLDLARKLFQASLEYCGNPSADTTQTRTCSLSRLRLADLEFSAKNWQAALVLYQELTKSHSGFPDADWVHYQLANTYKSQHRYELALNEYTRVIDNYPYSYWAAQAKWRREDTIWRKEFGEVID